MILKISCKNIDKRSYCELRETSYLLLDFNYHLNIYLATNHDKCLFQAYHPKKLLLFIKFDI